MYVQCMHTCGDIAMWEHNSFAYLNMYIHVYRCNLLPGSSCSVVQGADWHWGPSNTIHTDSNGSGQPKYIRDSALASFVLASILFFAYLVLQVCIQQT